MAFPYEKALVIGATSGIGLELAERLVDRGTSVIAVGRRQDRLHRFTTTAAARTKHAKAFGVAFDISQVEEIPAFAER